MLLFVVIVFTYKSVFAYVLVYVRVNACVCLIACMCVCSIPRTCGNTVKRATRASHAYAVPSIPSDARVEVEALEVTIVKQIVACLSI